MADLHIETNVTAPKSIHIPLVRADHLGMSSTFRICLDVSLAIAMTLLGASLNPATPVPRVQWIFFGVATVAAVAFLTCSIFWMRRAKHNGG